MSEGKKEIINGNCFDVLKTIEDASIDLILTDPPYNTTDCKWDIVIDYKKLWEEWLRVSKPTGSIVFTCQFPVLVDLVYDGMKYYRHRWIWAKDKSANFMVVSGQPLRYTEDIMVFSKRGHYKPANSKIDNAIYNPQTEVDIRRPKNPKHQPMKNIGASIGEIRKKQTEYLHKSNPENDGKIRFPNELLYFPVPFKSERFHPTQKPIELFEYLIKTYTNENMLVLDCFSGSGTTALAAMKTKRQFICIEKEQKYYDIILKRVADFNKNFEQQTLFGNEM